MKIHHLNCSTLTPVGGYFVDGMTKGIGHSHLVSHCLLIESDSGLILVDSGLGMKDIQNPGSRIRGLFKNLLQPALDEKETALRQLQDLGFSPADVRHIILTHLDFENAGGIDDFPNAKVHLLQAEKRAALKRDDFVSRSRYSPEQLHDIKKWKTYYPNGDSWFGFQAVGNLEGLPPKILLVPLIGHTEGHAGVAIETDNGWLLHAGDAYFYYGEMAPEYTCTPGLRALQRMLEVDRKSRQSNLKKLRDLVKNHSDEVTVFSAHDGVEFQALSSGMQDEVMTYRSNFSEMNDDLAGLGLS